MRDPTGVRSIVLDSVVPNRLILGESVAVNLQNALKADLGRCDAEPDCIKAFGNPYTDLTELRARIAKHPLLVTYRDPTTNVLHTRTLNEKTLAGVVRLFAYSPLTAALLPLTLHQALQGNDAPLMGQAQLISSEVGASSINPYMGLSVVCSEDVPWLKPNPAAKGTLLGRRFIRGLQRECAGWPRGRMPANFHQPLRTDIPTLILEGQDDPITPPRYGREVLAHLSDARLLIARGQGHAVIGTGCIPQLVGKFIAHLEPKSLDAQCLDVLRPAPPFVNYNGPSP
jgi:pimeloyl-ACP methyl ester carboxylesterase